MPGSSDNAAVLAQFCILMTELLRTGMRRANFQSWEIDILLDIESCAIPDSVKRKALLEYENAVHADMEDGAVMPMRFSEYLRRNGSTVTPRKPEGREVPLARKAKAGAN
jgi:hypothetical protein